MRGVISTVRTSSARLRGWRRHRRSSSQVDTPPWDFVRSPQVVPSPAIELFEDTSRRRRSNNNDEDYLQPIDSRPISAVELFPQRQTATFTNNNDNSDNNETFESAEEELNDNSNNDYQNINNNNENNSNNNKDNNNNNNNNNDNDNNNENSNNNNNNESDAAVISVSYYDRRDEHGNLINWPRGDFTDDSCSEDECVVYSKSCYASYSTVASVHSPSST